MRNVFTVDQIAILTPDFLNVGSHNAFTGSVFKQTTKGCRNGEWPLIYKNQFGLKEACVTVSRQN